MSYAEVMLYRGALNAEEIAATTNASSAVVLQSSLEVYASLDEQLGEAKQLQNRAQSMSTLTAK